MFAMEYIGTGEHQSLALDVGDELLGRLSEYLTHV
jgi:hypothetical protein